MHGCAPLLLLAMPDHLHIIVRIPSRLPIATFVARFKRAAGYGLDISWQRGAFDHRIRNDDSYREKWAYVLANPVRAGKQGQPERRRVQPLRSAPRALLGVLRRKTLAVLKKDRTRCCHFCIQVGARLRRVRGRTELDVSNHAFR